MIPIYCPLCCDQPFEDQDDLFHHLRSLRNNLFCPICSERFSSFDYLVSHLSRKCHGPASPHEAKRKCLFNKTISPDSLNVRPVGSPSSLDPGNAQGEVATESSPTKVTETTGSAVMCDSVVAAIPAPPATVPPEIRNRVPREVTVTMSPSDTLSSPQINLPEVKPLSTLLENKKSVKKSSVKPTRINNSLSVVLNKVSLNPNVEISVKTSKDSGSTPEKSVLSDSPSVSIITNNTESSGPRKQSGKAGPLSSKLKGNKSLTNSSQVQKEDRPFSKEVSDLDSKSENKKGKESNPKEEVSLSVQDENTKSAVQDENTKSGRRDRLKRTPIKDDANKIPVMNGIVNQENSSLESPVNERRSKQAKIYYSDDSTEEVSKKSCVRTRGKKVQSCNTLINYDDSDHFNDNASYSSDKNYEPEEKKKENSSGTTINNEPSKEQDKKTDEMTNEEPEKTKAESTKNVELEKTDEESEKNSLKVVLKTGKGADTFSVEESKTAGGDVEETKTAGGDVEETKTAGGDVEETKTEEEEEYTCSACNIRFTSIYEHIKQYHNGQEVVVEVPEEEIQEDLKAYQENSESLVSIADSESTNTAAMEIDEMPIVPVKEEKASPQRLMASEFYSDSNQSAAKSGDKKKKETTGFAAEGTSSDLVYTRSRSFRKVKKDTDGHWVQVQSDKKKLYQFVRDEDKYQMLMTELRNNTTIHPELKMPVKKLFENPKINVVEITYQPNSPFLTHRTINFKNPMPMFIVDRQATNNPEVLGGIASYIMAGKETDTCTAATEDSKVIGVMKVILASDKELTVENIVFNDKPANADMVPVLEDVKTPDIPLLRDAKILKWRCNKCLATTWKFPLHKETHYCNACPICHKTFISPVSLKKHLVLHKRDGTKYCKDCQAAFISKATLNSHLSVHITHSLCDKCHLFVLRDKIDEHMEVHSRDPFEQFPCSVCKKVFGSGQDLKNHETKLCSKLVAKFSCSQCDKKFFSLTALSYHTSAHNNVAIKLSCRFCPKTFIQEKEQCPKKAGKRKPSSYIQKIWHERIHTRDRPYMCKSCPKRFRSIEQEVQHNTKVHAPTSPTPLRNVHVHMCTYCDRVFRSEKQLTSHMTQHTAAAAE